MTAKMEYKGKDVDEAIKLACASLGVDREQLDIEVTSTGTSGIFGLCKKKAAVLVSLKEEGGAAEAVDVAGIISSKEEAPAPASVPTPAPAPAAPKQGRQRDEGAAAEKVVAGAPVPAEELEQIRAMLADLVRLMGCPSEVDISQDESNKVLAHLAGDNLDLLIGPEGQTLDSLQYVMRKMIGKRYPEKIVFALDAGGFREARMKELEERALALAREVKETGKTKAIPPINPAERRIVHMALQNDTAIRSRSVGEGLFKKVLIYLPSKGKKKPARRRKGSGGRTQK